MGETIVSTARGTANILSNRIIIDMANEIADLKPRVYPLTVLSKRLNTSPTHSYKFEWMEDDMMARWTAINNAGTAYADDTTELVVDDETIIAVGDIIKCVATGEMLKVTAIATATHTVTVTRGYGETAAAAGSVANDAKLLVVGNANMQGGVAPAEKYNNPTAVYNYTQIFKTPFSVTNTLEAMDLYGGKELSRLQAKKGVEHAMSIEYALMFGERKLDTSGSQPLSTTGGILKFLAGTENVNEITKTTTTPQKDMDAALEEIFTYGSESKVALCSPSFITWVNQMAQGKVQLIQADKDKTFGLDIVTYLTPHGKLNMTMHPLLVQGYADYAFILDMENISYRPLKGRDTKLMTNIQNNDEDGRRDMYQTEAGLEIKLPKTHGIIKLV